MDAGDRAATIVGVIAAIISTTAAVIAYFARKDTKRWADAAEKSLELSSQSVAASHESARSATLAVETAKEIARRQGVIDLHKAWSDISDLHLDPTKRVGQDERKAVNVLALTAALWNHDVIHREVLFQMHWDDFRHLFDKIEQLATPIQGFTRSPKSYLTSEVRSAYAEMQKRELDSVRKSHL